jgi:tungstate transport system substrate-binding protein
MIKSAIKVLSALFIIVTFSSSYAEEGLITMAVSQSIYQSGILRYFIPLFEKRMPYRLKAVSASNEDAIEIARSGGVDILFIDSSSLSDKFLADRSGINSQNVMHNFSVIIGPKDDPARIRGRDPVGAFKKIAKGGYPFYSCTKCPDVNKMEERLWKEAGLAPGKGWYLKEETDMEGLINSADKRSAYALSDRAAYIKLKERINLDLLVDRQHLLFNQFIIIEVNPEKFPLVNNIGARAFSEFVTSGEGEDIIRRFGVDRFDEPLFYPQ